MRPAAHPSRRARLLRMSTVSLARLGGHAHTLFRAGHEFVCRAHCAARDWRALRGQADVVQERPALAGLSRAQLPTLLVDGRPLTEVAAILHYLAKRFPDAGLLPRDDIEADAQALSWMSFAASTLHPARTRGLDHAREVWGIADQRLGAGPLFDRRHPSVSALL